VRGIVVALAAALFPLSDGRARPVTVEDSIGMTRLVDPGTAAVFSRAGEFKWSPDGTRVFFVLRRGDLNTGENEYFLDLLGSEQVLECVNARAGCAAPPIRERLATFRTSSPRHAIASARWLDDRTIAFIGITGQKAAQAYSIDIHSKAMLRLSDHGTDVVDFAVPPQQTTLLYWANVYPDWTSRNARGYAVTSESAANLGMSDPSEAEPEVELFAADLASNARRRVDLHRGLIPHPISVSPRGNFAIVAATVRSIPVSWWRYAIVSGNPTLTMPSSPEGESGVAAARFLEQDDAFSRSANWMSQYHLVDVERGTTKALIDAPAALAGRLDTAIWSPDGEHALVSATYVTEATLNCGPRDRLAESQFVVEFDVKDGVARCVGEVAARSESGDRLVLVDARWNSNEAISVDYVELDGLGRLRRDYARLGRQWKPRRGASRRAPEVEPQIRLSIRQDADTPPDVLATDTRTGRTTLVTDLNSGFRELDLGTVRDFEWRDRLGRQFVGGLVLPSAYDDKKRYPVVFQTYGYRRDEFLIDGPLGITTAYAARPLAGRGMLVLQLPRLHARSKATAGGSEVQGENAYFLAGLEGAIEALDLAGVIDTARMGLIGFSREGMHVHHALAFSKYRFVAATIADAIGATPFCYSFAYGLPFPGMHEFEDDDRIGLGGPFWGDNVDQWVERSYIFHLHSISAAIRYEQIGSYGTSCHWDAFAFQKRAKRPVEMIHIPLDEHNAQTPFGRFTSQEGNVDWFSFWLLAQEDRGSDKSEQYRRWGKLRAVARAFPLGDKASP